MRLPFISLWGHCYSSEDSKEPPSPPIVSSPHEAPPTTAPVACRQALLPKHEPSPTAAVAPQQAGSPIQEPGPTGPVASMQAWSKDKNQPRPGRSRRCTPAHRDRCRFLMTNVTRSCYTRQMAGIKQTVLHVRLTDTQDEAISAVESRYGGRSELVRIALDRFLEETARREAMSEFVDAWVVDAGASSAEELAEMDRFFS